MLRNTPGQNWRAVALQNGQRLTGDAANITASIRLDGGALIALTSPPTPVGQYYDFALTQQQTNGQYLAEFFGQSSTPGVLVIGVPEVQRIYDPPPTAGAGQDGTISSIPDIIEARLFSLNTGNLVATADSVVPDDDDASFYVITFNGVVPDSYRLVLYADDNGVPTEAAYEPVVVVELDSWRVPGGSLDPIVPPVEPGLCTVRFRVLHAGAAVEGAKVYAELEELNPTVDTALISRAETRGTTNASGEADLTMIQFVSFTRGGIYRIRVTDTSGRILHDRRITVPTLSTCYAEDLLDA